MKSFKSSKLAKFFAAFLALVLVTSVIFLIPTQAAEWRPGAQSQQGTRHFFGREYTGNVTVEFHITPFDRAASGNINASIALFGSNNPIPNTSAAGLPSLPIVVRMFRFNFDAFNRTDFAWDASIRPQTGWPHHVQLDVRLSEQTYDMWVDGVLVAENFVFRSTANAPINLTGMALYSASGNEFKIENVRVNGEFIIGGEIVHEGVWTPGPTAGQGQRYDFGRGYTGNVSVEFYVTPFERASSGGLNASITLFGINNPYTGTFGTDISRMPIILRMFGSEFNAINGTGFERNAFMRARADWKHHVRMDIRMDQRTYDIWVDGVRIAENFRFRSSAQTPINITGMALYSTTGDEFKIENVKVNGTQISGGEHEPNFDFAWHSANGAQDAVHMLKRPIVGESILVEFDLDHPFVQNSVISLGGTSNNPTGTFSTGATAAMPINLRMRNGVFDAFDGATGSFRTLWNTTVPDPTDHQVVIAIRSSGHYDVAVNGIIIAENFRFRTPMQDLNKFALFTNSAFGHDYKINNIRINGEQVGSFGELAPDTITTIHHEPVHLTVFKGTPRSDLELPTTVSVAINHNTSIDVPVYWAGVYNPNRPGTDILTGTPGFGTSIANPQNLTTTATVTVVAENIIEIIAPSAINLVVPRGTPRGNLVLPQRATVRTDLGYEHIVPLVWSGFYDPNTLGINVLTGAFVIGGRMANPQNLAVTATITVDSVAIGTIESSLLRLTVPRGTARADLALPTETTITTNFNAERVVPIAWTGYYNADIPGIYILTGTPPVSSQLTNPRRFIIRAAVIVFEASEQIDLRELINEAKAEMADTGKIWLPVAHFELANTMVLVERELRDSNANIQELHNKLYFQLNELRRTEMTHFYYEVISVIRERIENGEASPQAPAMLERAITRYEALRSLGQTSDENIPTEQEWNVHTSAFGGYLRGSM